VFAVAAVHEAVRAVCQFSHQLSDTIVLGFATSHTASIEAGEGVPVLFVLANVVLHCAPTIITFIALTCEEEHPAHKN